MTLPSKTAELAPQRSFTAARRRCLCRGMCGVGDGSELWERIALTGDFRARAGLGSCELHQRRSHCVWQACRQGHPSQRHMFTVLRCDMRCVGGNKGNTELHQRSTAAGDFTCEPPPCTPDDGCLIGIGPAFSHCLVFASGSWPLPRRFAWRRATAVDHCRRECSHANCCLAFLGVT